MTATQPTRASLREERAAVLSAEVEKDPALMDPGGQPVRLLDFTLGALVLMAFSRGLGPLSVGLVALGLLVGVALFRTPTRPLGPLSWLPAVMIVAISYLMLVSVITPDHSLGGWPKRALRLTLVGLYLVTLVTGRVHYPSVVRGMAFGLMANAAAFFAGLAPHPYGSYLSGWVLDKNQAGLMYAVVALLFVGLVRSRTRQALVLVVASGLVWTTGSRTSIAALAFGTVWFLLRDRLSVFGRLVLGGAIAFGVQFLTEDYSQVGVFADREGSDWFRSQIDAASQIKLDLAPWYGSGLGEAWVKIPQGNFFFHNSYWSAMVEGGWALAAGYVVLTVVLGVGLFRKGPSVGRWAAAAEGANIIVLVAAIRLGEVFGTTVAMTALGAGMLSYLAYRAREDAQGGSSP
jgi:hypothetical protein